MCLSDEMFVIIPHALSLSQVLYLEQLLTTGGGWQDQIGGLKGKVHLGLSDAKLPLCVEAIDLKITPAKTEEFNNRWILIYTGKTRLARNLLQVRIHLISA